MISKISKRLNLYNILLLLFVVSIFNQAVWNGTVLWKSIVVVFCIISIFKIIRSKRLYVGGYYKWISYLIFVMTFIGLISNYQQESFIYTKQFIKVAIFSYLIISNCKNQKDVEFILISLWIAGLTISISLIMNFDMNAVRAVETNLTSTRLGLGGIEHPNTTAYNIIISYILGVYFVINYNVKKSKKIFFVIGQILLTIGCILTGSRKVLISIVLVPLMIIIYKSKNPIKLIIRLIMVILISLTIYTYTQRNEVLYNIVGHRIEDIQGILTGNDESATGREYLIEQALQIGISKPFGVGVNCFKFYSYDGAYAHNEYLEIFADLGLIGLLIYYIPILKIFGKFIIDSCLNKKRDKKLNYYWGILIFNILILEIFQITFNIFSYHVIISLILSKKIFENSNENVVSEEYA